MTEPTNGNQVFIEMDGQQQYPIAQVFTHYTLQIEHPVKEEIVEQEIIEQVELVPTEQNVADVPQVIDKDNRAQVEQQSAVTQTVNTAIPVVMHRCTELLINNMICPYSTPIEDRLIRHIRKVHKGENPFQCGMCDYSTYNKAVFEEHVRVHQGIKPFKCTFCDYCSASKKNTKKHEQIHRPDNPNKCDECDFIARHYKSLKRHKEEEHKSVIGAQRPVVYKDGPRPFKRTLQCKRCDTKFKAVKNMNDHNRKSRNCQECGLELCSKMHEVKHMMTAHNRLTGAVLFTCSVCGWQTNTRPKALLHLVHHPQPVDGSFDVEVLRRHHILE